MIGYPPAYLKSEKELEEESRQTNDADSILIYLDETVEGPGNIQSSASSEVPETGEKGKYIPTVTYPGLNLEKAVEATVRELTSPSFPAPLLSPSPSYPNAPYDPYQRPHDGYLNNYYSQQTPPPSPYHSSHQNNFTAYQGGGYSQPAQPLTPSSNPPSPSTSTSTSITSQYGYNPYQSSPSPSFAGYNTGYSSNNPYYRSNPHFASRSAPLPPPPSPTITSDMGESRKRIFDQFMEEHPIDNEAKESERERKRPRGGIPDIETVEMEIDAVDPLSIPPPLSPPLPAPLSSSSMPPPSSRPPPPPPPSTPPPPPIPSSSSFPFPPPVLTEFPKPKAGSAVEKLLSQRTSTLQTDSGSGVGGGAGGGMWNKVGPLLSQFHHSHRPQDPPLSSSSPPPPSAPSPLPSQGQKEANI